MGCVIPPFLLLNYFDYQPDCQIYLPLVIVAIVGSMISVYFYIRPIVAMYANHPSATSAIDSSSNYKKQIILAAVLMILLGLIPGVIINLI
ncbi:MAG: hypothetical protein WC542_01495 [Paludibacter sp.]